MNLGMPELIIILILALLLFGAGRLPEVAKSFGLAIKEFKKSMSGEPEEAALVSRRTKKKTKR